LARSAPAGSLDAIVRLPRRLIQAAFSYGNDALTAPWPSLPAVTPVAVAGYQY